LDYPPDDGVPWGVAKPGKGKGALAVANAPLALIDIIEERRKPLGWTKSQFTLAILQYWQAQGCPAVAPIDKMAMTATEAARAMDVPMAAEPAQAPYGVGRKKLAS